jgi:uncharacterized protein YndB with AHSA1/START domain
MTIVITKQIAAQPERVFRALTDADELGRWFASTAESDPHTGGEYVLRFDGQFGETTAEFVLKPGGSGTDVRLHHSGWVEEAAESRQLHEQGWGFFLDNLERYLTGGDDQRAAVLQMKTATSGAATAAGP